MKAWFSYWYRRLTKHCLLCNIKLKKFDLPAAWSRLKYCCRSCNKMWNHASNYGMNKDRLISVLTSDHKTNTVRIK